MIIFQNRKTIFFHNPRTGGNAISEDVGVLQMDNPYQHMSTADAKQWVFQETWSDYWRFSFVRNPWDRYASLYEYLYNNKGAPKPKSNSHTGRADQYGFDEWVYLCRNKFLHAQTFGTPQTNWSDDVDNVFRYEERASALPIISERLGIQLSNERRNASIRRMPMYTDYYKKQSSIDAIAEIDASTIKTFGYRFGE